MIPLNGPGFLALAALIALAVWLRYRHVTGRDL